MRHSGFPRRSQAIRERVRGIVSEQETTALDDAPVEEGPEGRCVQDIDHEMDAGHVGIITYLVGESHFEVPEFAGTHDDRAVANEKPDLGRRDDRDVQAEEVTGDLMDRVGVPEDAGAGLQTQQPHAVLGSGDGINHGLEVWTSVEGFGPGEGGAATALCPPAAARGPEGDRLPSAIVERAEVPLPPPFVEGLEVGEELARVEPQRQPAGNGMDPQGIPDVTNLHDASGKRGDSVGRRACTVKEFLTALRSPYYARRIH